LLQNVIKPRKNSKDQKKGQSIRWKRRGNVKKDYKSSRGSWVWGGGGQIFPGFAEGGGQARKLDLKGFRVDGIGREGKADITFCNK